MYVPLYIAFMPLWSCFAVLTLRTVRRVLVRICAALIVLHHPEPKTGAFPCMHCFYRICTALIVLHCSDPKAGACLCMHCFDHVCTALIVLSRPDPKDPNAGACLCICCFDCVCTSHRNYRRSGGPRPVKRQQDLWMPEIHRSEWPVLFGYGRHPNWSNQSVFGIIRKLFKIVREWCLSYADIVSTSWVIQV